MVHGCTGTLWADSHVELERNEWPGQGSGCGECVRVHWYTMSKQ